MEQRNVERSIWIDVPRERVWQAITDPAELAQWLLPPALGAQLRRDSNDTILLNMGGMEIPIAILEEVEPPRHVRSYGLPDHVISITYLLEEENDGTRVTVTMSGFEKLPVDARQDRVLPSGMAWEKALANLEAHVTGMSLPFPEGYVAALFGYRRETEKSFAVERSIWIAAPRERVWSAITDPTQLENWFSPGTSWTLTALEVGGRLFIPDPDTGDETNVQVIQLLDPPEHFVTHSLPESPGSSEVTAYLLQEERGGTRLTITNSGYELLPDDGRWSAMEQNAFGFGMMLENLRAYLESRDLPTPGGF
ncbi:MAG TPA: SRPBCC domain-containing protein [Anaerolineales bacterium]|nr:SRPBCC domain-containing protein [Anaerolineales bacterium]